MTAYETPSTIVVLQGLEAIRRRPGMYVGDVDVSGLHNMLWEVIDNLVDEHLHGTATYVRVQIDGDTVIAEDDGSGIPVDRIPHEPTISELEAAFTRMSSHFFIHRSPHQRSFFGLAVANALSASLEVEVWRDGRTYRQRHERGVPRTPVEDIGPTSRTGTRVTFTPDFTVFARHAWDVAAVARRLRSLAALTPGLTLIGPRGACRYPDGLVDHARHLAGSAARLHRDPIHLRGAHDGIEVEAALLWTDRPAARGVGFVNRQPSRGTHIQGLSAGVRRAFDLLAPDRMKGVYPAAFREVIAPGLLGLVRVVLDDPRFSYGKTRRLVDPEARVAVCEVVGSGLADALAQTPALRDRLLARMPG